MSCYGELGYVEQISMHRPWAHHHSGKIQHRGQAICLLRNTKVLTYIITQCRDGPASISFVLHSCLSQVDLAAALVFSCVYCRALPFDISVIRSVESHSRQDDYAGQDYWFCVSSSGRIGFPSFLWIETQKGRRSVSGSIVWLAIGN